MTLRIFVWEGNGISDAYHDDGTLVVLAESPEQAREVVRANGTRLTAEAEAWTAERDELAARLGFATPGGRLRQGFWQTPEGVALYARSVPFASQTFDGKDEALDREPDRIEDLDEPKWIAFNGGGYD